MTHPLFQEKLIEKLHALHTFAVFPEDLNYNGTLFGGKILAEMDIAAAKVARRLLYGTPCDGAVTASLDKVNFRKPALLGDMIEMKARLTGLGNASIQISVKVIKEDKYGNREQICEAMFTFVALRDNKPHPHFCRLLPRKDAVPA